MVGKKKCSFNFGYVEATCFTQMTFSYGFTASGARGGDERGHIWVKKK
jgi:hypothetical protein